MLKFGVLCLVTILEMPKNFPKKNTMVFKYTLANLSCLHQTYGSLQGTWLVSEHL